MRIAFFTIVGDEYYYPVGTTIMINSFKRFHPDIDLVIFRQDMIDKVFKEKNVNFYNSKPTFAKLLTGHYDLICNVDADHIFLGRCEEILKGDYDIGCPINKNDYENTSVENVTEDMFLQGGMVASTNKRFWDIWEERNKDAMSYKCKENDVMNLVIFNDCKDMKLKIFDKDKDYYGCKSLNREGEFYIEGGKVMCRGEQVFAYHVAKGGRLPKFNWDSMGFKQEVIDVMKVLGNYGKTIRIGSF